MNDSLTASFWLAMAVQTIGAVDMPGSGARKLPAPRQYVAILLAWSGLNLLADAGQERGAATAGWVMVLATLVNPNGTSGNKVLGLLSGVAREFGINPSTVLAPGATSSTPATAPQTFTA